MRIHKKFSTLHSYWILVYGTVGLELEVSQLSHFHRVMSFNSNSINDVSSSAVIARHFVCFLRFLVTAEINLLSDRDKNIKQEKYRRIR